MCGIYGIVYYGDQSYYGVATITEALGKEAAERGTDATGIAYISNTGELLIRKAPKSAYKFKFDIPLGSNSVMGHTRWATQGKAKDNYNNHPFMGYCDGRRFALAHNGVINNDYELRKRWSIETPKIETDTYIAVQLLEMHNKYIDADSLGWMAEQIEGMYTFTVLDDIGNIWIVKGSSPICIAHIPKLQVYIYGSTQYIVTQAMMMLPSYAQEVFNSMMKGKPEDTGVYMYGLNEGDILKIGFDGSIAIKKFHYTETSWYNAYTHRGADSWKSTGYVTAGSGRVSDVPTVEVRDYTVCETCTRTPDECTGIDTCDLFDSQYDNTYETEKERLEERYANEYDEELREHAKEKAQANAELGKCECLNLDDPNAEEIWGYDMEGFPTRLMGIDADGNPFDEYGETCISTPESIHMLQQEIAFQAIRGKHTVGKTLQDAVNDAVEEYKRRESEAALKMVRESGTYAKEQEKKEA